MRILLSLKDDRVEQLDDIAERMQVHRSTVIRWAIDNYLSGGSFSVPNCISENTIGKRENQSVEPVNA